MEIDWKNFTKAMSVCVAVGAVVGMFCVYVNAPDWVMYAAAIVAGLRASDAYPIFK